MKPVLLTSHTFTADQVLSTPFGAVAHGTINGMTAIRQGELDDARALVWAAKELGATVLLAIEAVEATTPLLESGDFVIPVDVIDQMKLRPHTFFPGKGYGFIQMTAPFCPAWSSRLHEVARAQNPRTFAKAVYVGTEGPRELTPAERGMYAQWGAHVAGTSLLPAAFLARELELCFAALTVIGPAVTSQQIEILVQAAAKAANNTCICGEAMARSKAAGSVGPDWKSWVVVPQ